jgi:hypothetical protein
VKVHLGVTFDTTFSQFLEKMHSMDLWSEAAELELSPEEYEVVSQKFVHRHNQGKDHKGEFCWRITVFRPEQPKTDSATEAEERGRSKLDTR